MVIVKNANVGRGENYEEGGSSRGGRTGKGKGKKVASEVRLPKRFISIKEAANFEEWTRKWRKIAPGHRFDLSDMEVMEIIPNFFEEIGWGPSLTVNELYYHEMILNFLLIYIKEEFKSKEILLINGLHLGEKRFEELFTKGEVLKRHDDRNVNKLDAYGRSLHHMISNIIIPNVGHKTSITNMHSFEIVLQEEQNMHKRSLKGNLQRSKRSLKTTRLYEDEVIKLKTLKTRRMAIRCLCNTP
ncbi:hypothetical protein M9H77_02371 [Catharanthus roseus]|uniref:Uncharacterized protein n=1 Tax=Catharanthus roseus TaxID=4058 RepID=A0ACC0C8C1_CATRO|nr:hypothetical protein M9H77_02371 [Catharanthus roseus]